MILHILIKALFFCLFLFTTFGFLLYTCFYRFQTIQWYSFINKLKYFIKRLTLFRMGFFWAAHGWQRGLKKASLSRSSHTYSTTMKLGTVIPYPKKIQKICKSRDTPLEFWWHQQFLSRNQQILQYQEIQR